MNTLDYIGSKKSLIPFLHEKIKEHIPYLDKCVFGDLFAGAGNFSFFTAPLVKTMIANDLEEYSYIINKALISCEFTQTLQELINELNKLDVDEGIVYKNFSPNKHCERMFFTPENAKLIDAMRKQLYMWLFYNEINQKEHDFLLASLLVSLDKVSNTSCVYGAYLKEFKKSAKKKLIIVPIHTKTENNETNSATIGSAEIIAKNYEFDVVYLDPPYNHRQYAANYSPLNYIVSYDESVVLTGKTGLMKNYNKSGFCSKRKVKKSFETLIENLNTRYIFLSYNNEGLLSQKELKTILEKKGEVILYQKEYPKFKGRCDVDGDTVTEYLWFVEVVKN
jgi:adenine-specific DNA-methyltransferase